MAMVYDVPGLFVRMIERNRRPINFFSFFYNRFSSSNVCSGFTFVCFSYPKRTLVKHINLLQDDIEDTFTYIARQHRDEPSRGITKHGSARFSTYSFHDNVRVGLLYKTHTHI